jgi:hypothetical protein
VGLAAKHIGDASDDAPQTATRRVSGRLAAVVVLGLRRGFAPRGEQIGCQLRGQLPAEAAATAAVAAAAARVARGQESTRYLPKKPASTTAAVGSTALFTASE